MVNEKIPVNVISGFLGSGKTTAIIRLLKDKISEERWAVIINEFGKVSIDSQTLGISTETSNIYEVSGGCICCSAKGYLQDNLEQIISNREYTRIIIEPSGLGGIDMVSEIVTANSDLKLMKIICLVDILNMDNARLQQLPIYHNQINKADLIVFTKVDLLEDPKGEGVLVEKFKTYYQGKPCILKREENLFWPGLIDILDSEIKEDIKFRIISAGENQLTDANYQVISQNFEIDVFFSTDRLVRFFNDHPAIIRAKGYLLTDKGWSLMNFTLSGCIFEPSGAKAMSEIIVITERSAGKGLQNIIDEIKKMTQILK